MTKGRNAGWLTLLAAAILSLPATAEAGPKLLIFPIEMSIPRTEMDFFAPAVGPSPAEQERLKKANAELAKLIETDGRYDLVDIAPYSADIEAAQPISECNGCEIDIGAKAGADLLMVSVLSKISETHLSLTVSLIDVAKSGVVSNSSVLIQGNTDESWQHGVRWLARNRLLVAEGKPQ